MEFPDEIYKNIAEILSNAYMMIDWKKTGQKNAYDYFAVRVRSAGHERTVPSAIDRLAKRCNLMSFDIDPDTIALLEANQKLVLQRLRKESVYIALLSANVAKAKKLNIR